LRLDIPEKLDIDELSLVMAVSNLMENAIAATSELPPEQRTLRFIAVNVGQLIFELSNPYDGEVVLDEDGFPISREEGHGKGTQSVADFAKECGGELVYEVSDGVFKVRLMV
jgi:sensor histidine kinase regulating citrate/malate metabolism